MGLGVLMKLKEYFDQDKYFSESEQELLDIDSMPFPHAFHAWMKLCETYSMNFYDTRLNRAFMKRLSPSAEHIRNSLQQSGYATHLAFHPKHAKAVRSKFYRAAKQIGVKVKTHVKTHWVTAEVVTGTQVRVKGEKI